MGNPRDPQSQTSSPPLPLKSYEDAFISRKEFNDFYQSREMIQMLPAEKIEKPEMDIKSEVKSSVMRGAR